MDEVIDRVGLRGGKPGLDQEVAKQQSEPGTGKCCHFQPGCSLVEENVGT